MIFAHGPGAGMFLFALYSIPLLLIVGLSLATLILQGACPLLNRIAPGPHGENAVPRPRFGKALGIIVLAVAVNSLVTSLVYWVSCGEDFLSPGPFEILLAFALGLTAMSAVAARMLGALLWKSAVVMLIPSAIAFSLGFPQLWVVLLWACGFRG